MAATEKEQGDRAATTRAGTSRPPDPKPLSSAAPAADAKPAAAVASSPPATEARPAPPPAMPAPPPAAPRAVASPSSAGDAPDAGDPHEAGDHTQLLKRPPPVPRVRPSPPAGETRGPESAGPTGGPSALPGGASAGAGAPSAPPGGSPSGAPSPPPPARADESARAGALDGEESGTIVLGDLFHPVRLHRMQPAERSEMVNLDQPSYLVGRVATCDVRLYSPTASREHARITARGERWYLQPLAGKVVVVNGAKVREEVQLTHKMRLQFGGDELVFIDENASPAEAGTASGATRTAWVIVMLVAAVALALGAWWLLASR